MFAKTIFALFAVVARIAVAAPPACLLAAVNSQTDPSSLKAVCSGSNVTQVEQYICKNCGSNFEAAVSDFISVCGTVGVTVANFTTCSFGSSSSSSASASASTSASASSSRSASATAQVIVTTGKSSVSTVTSSASQLTTATGNAAASATSASPSVTSANGGSGSGTSSTGSAASASSTKGAYTGVAARLGMDIVGLAALGAFGAMLAM